MYGMSYGCGCSASIVHGCHHVYSDRPAGVEQTPAAGGVSQVVLHGRVGQAESVGGRLLRTRDENRGDHSDLAIGGASGGVAGPAARSLRGPPLR